MTVDVGVVECSLLDRYARWVVHMRQQVEDERFGVILGAGASKDIGFPLWSELISRIANDPEMQAATILASAGELTSKSQLLYQHFRRKVIGDRPSSANLFDKHEMKVRAGWQNIVRRCLYSSSPATDSDLEKRDIYLRALLPTIRKTKLTINYNFDDSLERLLSIDRSDEDRRRRRGFVTIWDPHSQVFPRDPVIYHPNGFLPRNQGQRGSDSLIFLEESFADQLIATMGGHYSSLLHHLSQKTWLFIGHSLSDPIVRHLLRESGQMLPGHYHYFVAHKNGRLTETDVEHDVFDSNFGVYNLVTLFLTTEEIVALANLLAMDDTIFARLMQERGCPPVYKFMVTGCVSVGKTTVVSQFGSLRMHDEWLDERKPGMERDPANVPPDRTAEINDWVDQQVELKNLDILEAKLGMHITDRAPLDAFAFVPTESWRDRAKSMIARVCGEKAQRRLASSAIILLTGDPEVMAVRCIGRNKDMGKERLTTEQGMLERVYRGFTQKGVYVVDTRAKSVPQVTREVARILYVEPYLEMPMADVLDHICDGSFTAAP